MIVWTRRRPFWRPRWKYSSRKLKNFAQCAKKVEKCFSGKMFFLILFVYSISPGDCNFGTLFEKCSTKAEEFPLDDRKRWKKRHFSRESFPLRVPMDTRNEVMTTLPKTFCQKVEKFLVNVTSGIGKNILKLFLLKKFFCPRSVHFGKSNRKVFATKASVFRCFSANDEKNSFEEKFVYLKFSSEFIECLFETLGGKWLPWSRRLFVQRPKVTKKA